jgi:hypothetical protein
VGAEIKTSQDKMEANQEEMKTTQVEMKADREVILARIEDSRERADTNLKEMNEQMLARLEAKDRGQ